jgi:hypothetical protein
MMARKDRGGYSSAVVGETPSPAIARAKSPNVRIWFGNGLSRRSAVIPHINSNTIQRGIARVNDEL